MEDRQKRIPLTRGQKLGIIAKLIYSLFCTSIQAIRAPFSSRGDRPWTASQLRRNLLFKQLRLFTGSLEREQMQSLYPSPSDIYAAFTKRHGLTPNILVAPDGQKAYWVGPNSADYVIVWFHGGGYSTALTEDHFELSYSLLQDQRPSSIAILQATYPLSPPSMYPAQLRSATTLLKHLLDPDTSPLRSPRPSRILLAGDSAGGHLVLSLLGHIAFPHPDTSIPRLTVEGADRSFMGTVLVSPWASCEEEGKESMSVNRDDDILAVDLQKRWGLGYQGHAPSDEYTWPLFEGRREGWWEKVGELVDGILMISGADEILGSGIAELTKQIKVAIPQKFTGFTAVHGFHNELVLARRFGWEAPEQETVLRRWIAARMQASARS